MGSINHPRENDLALLAGGEAGRIQRFLLDRHVRNCTGCQDQIAEFQELRSSAAQIELPDVNWNFLAADMRANIRLGLEAGACVGASRVPMRWNARRTFALASVLVLIVAGEFLRDARPRAAQAGTGGDNAATVLESTGSGVEIHTGAKSLALLNHHGNAANQTVSARGDIETRYIDSDTGAVTIDNVYLQ